jgi:hypothetical protein
MKLEGDTGEIKAPGQFIDIQLDGLYLRRPMSICDYDENSLSIIYTVVGKGTRLMSTFTKGDSFKTLVGLGNGFDLSDIPDNAVLIGGGAGLVRDLVVQRNHKVKKYCGRIPRGDCLPNYQCRRDRSERYRKRIVKCRLTTNSRLRSLTVRCSELLDVAQMT